jgi:hypothetical protein
LAICQLPPVQEVLDRLSWPAVEGIGSLSSFNLCEGGGDRKAVGGSEPS